MSNDAFTLVQGRNNDGFDHGDKRFSYKIIMFSLKSFWIYQSQAGTVGPKNDWMLLNDKEIERVLNIPSEGKKTQSIKHPTVSRKASQKILSSILRLLNATLPYIQVLAITVKLPSICFSCHSFFLKFHLGTVHL